MKEFDTSKLDIRPAANFAPDCQVIDARDFGKMQYTLLETIDELKDQRDQLKVLLIKEHGCVTISRNGYIEELEQQRDQLTHELAEARELNEMRKETMRQMREAYGIGPRHIMRELKDRCDKLTKQLEDSQPISLNNKQKLTND